jgi:O-succinylbenzoate synthase
MMGARFEQISFSPYRLEGSRPRDGALVRLDFAGGLRGYADLHPWTGFGDRPLADECAALTRGEPTRLGCRTLAIARRDAEARAAGRSLFAGLRIPPSHWLVPSLTEWPQRDRDLDRLAAAGFTRLKIKLGQQLADEIGLLHQLFPRLPDGVRVRLDFNSRLSPQALRHFLEATRPWHAWIDFLEDPCPDLGQWERARGRYPIDLACDRDLDRVRTEGPEVEVLVVKPALFDPLAWARESGALPDRWVVTSYLDHPLGQAAAAVAAGELAATHPGWVDVCGLRSQALYAASAFSEALPGSGPDFPAPEGVGLGFDPLLEGLAWRAA